ncbi:MAG: heme ABC transporter ATP-binding protein [Pseudomonadota bacterium]
MTLAAQELSVHAGPTALLEHVSLSLSPGEVLAILGANGAGKSTLLGRLAGERGSPVVRTTGRVLLDARPIESWRPRELARRRAVLPQNPSLAFGYTALELAALGRHASGDDARAALAIAREALRATDAAHLADREVPTLSGGERARAHLACALAQLWDAECDHARYLLLDEPTAALDLAHQHEVLGIVREFTRTRGVGVVAIVHDLNLAAEYADRVALLVCGRLAAVGESTRVLDPGNVEAAFDVRARTLEHPLRPGPLIAVARRSAPGGGDRRPPHANRHPVSAEP